MANPRELLTPAGLQILLSLEGGARHGYAIKQDVEERAAGTLRLGPGTLYEAIHRMVKSGWIEQVPGEEPGARRKVYRLTSEGRRRMREELERLDAIVRYARHRELLTDSDGP